MNMPNAPENALQAARALAQERLAAGARALQKYGCAWAISEHQWQPPTPNCGGRQLCRVFYRHAGATLKAVVYADGVVRVIGVKTRMLLAVSEPGKPGVLSASFEPLTAADLAPQIQ